MQKVLWIGLALSITAESAIADMTIATWNIQRLGHNNQKSFEQLGVVAGKADFIAVQEVMTEEAVSNLERSLESTTGEPWSALSSDATGRGSYKERYAFLWRESKVAYEDGAVSYLDRHDIFEREPFSAQFRELATSKLFVAATVHVLYGDGPEDRAPEIRKLAEYWNWLDDVYPGNANLFLMGDFNMPPSDRAWDELKVYAKPLVTKGASTLSAQDGKFANLYDNIFVRKGGGPDVSQAFVLNYPRLIGWSHKKARKHLSDHAPVFIQVSLLAKSDSGIGRPSAPFSHAGTERPTELATITKESPSEAGIESVRGNKNSKTFHREDCPSYNAIGMKNRVEFSSAASAIASGYRLAGNCN